MHQFSFGDMKFLVRFFRLLPAVLLFASLNGCVPGQDQSDEEKEPHFMAGKSAVASMDYPGAIEEFEKAVEVNPHSASGHFELAWLYDQKEPDPAAAIYHYQQYLKLRPNAGNAETAKTRILACKQDLAKAVLPLPSTPGVQRDLEQLAEENRRLTQEVEQWRAYYKTQQQAPIIQSNASITAVTVSNGSPTLANSGRTSPADPRGTVRQSGRTHTVQTGDTFANIARKYSVKLDSLVAANPGIDAKRLRVGQTLNIP